LANRRAPRARTLLHQRRAIETHTHYKNTRRKMENGNTYDYDLVTIGAGSGGTRASRFSAQHYGAKVAIVELPFRQIADDDHGGAGGT